MKFCSEETMEDLEFPALTFDGCMLSGNDVYTSSQANLSKCSPSLLSTVSSLPSVPSDVDLADILSTLLSPSSVQRQRSAKSEKILHSVSQTTLPEQCNEQPSDRPTSAQELQASVETVFAAANCVSLHSQSSDEVKHSNGASSDCSSESHSGGVPLRKPVAVYQVNQGVPTDDSDKVASLNTQEVRPQPLVSSSSVVFKPIKPAADPSVKSHDTANTSAFTAIAQTDDVQTQNLQTTTTFKPLNIPSSETPQSFDFCETPVSIISSSFEESSERSGSSSTSFSIGGFHNLLGVDHVTGLADGKETAADLKIKNYNLYNRCCELHKLVNDVQQKNKSLVLTHDVLRKRSDEMSNMLTEESREKTALLAVVCKMQHERAQILKAGALQGDIESTQKQKVLVAANALAQKRSTDIEGYKSKIVILERENADLKQRLSSEIGSAKEGSGTHNTVDVFSEATSIPENLSRHESRKEVRRSIKLKGQLEKKCAEYSQVKQVLRESKANAQKLNKENKCLITALSKLQKKLEKIQSKACKCKKAKVRKSKEDVDGEKLDGLLGDTETGINGVRLEDQLYMSSSDSDAEENNEETIESVTKEPGASGIGPHNIKHSVNQPIDTTKDEVTCNKMNTSHIDKYNSIETSEDGGFTDKETSGCPGKDDIKNVDAQDDGIKEDSGFLDQENNSSSSNLHVVGIDNESDVESGRNDIGGVRVTRSSCNRKNETSEDTLKQSGIKYLDECNNSGQIPGGESTASSEKPLCRNDRGRSQSGDNVAVDGMRTRRMSGRLHGAKCSASADNLGCIETSKARVCSGPNDHVSSKSNDKRSSSGPNHNLPSEPTTRSGNKMEKTGDLSERDRLRALLHSNSQWDAIIAENVNPCFISRSNPCCTSPIPVIEQASTSTVEKPVKTTVEKLSTSNCSIEKRVTRSAKRRSESVSEEDVVPKRILRSVSDNHLVRSRSASDQSGETANPLKPATPTPPTQPSSSCPIVANTDQSTLDKVPNPIAVQSSKTTTDVNQKLLTLLTDVVYGVHSDMEKLGADIQDVVPHATDLVLAELTVISQYEYKNTAIKMGQACANNTHQTCSVEKDTTTMISSLTDCLTQAERRVCQLNAVIERYDHLSQINLSLLCQVQQKLALSSNDQLVNLSLEVKCAFVRLYTAVCRLTGRRQNIEDVCKSLFDVGGADVMYRTERAETLYYLLSVASVWPHVLTWNKEARTVMDSYLLVWQYLIRNAATPNVSRKCKADILLCMDKLCNWKSECGEWRDCVVLLHSYLTSYSLSSNIVQTAGESFTVTTMCRDWLNALRLICVLKEVTWKQHLYPVLILEWLRLELCSGGASDMCIVALHVACQLQQWRPIPEAENKLAGKLISMLCDHLDNTDPVDFRVAHKIIETLESYASYEQQSVDDSVRSWLKRALGRNLDTSFTEKFQKYKDRLLSPQKFRRQKENVKASNNNNCQLVIFDDDVDFD